jgi:hypothetical protein
VPRLVEILLNETLAATERGNRLACRGFEQLGYFFASPGDLEPAPAAAECRFDRDRQPVDVDELEHLLCAGHRVQRPRRERSADLLGDVASGDLVAELLDGIRGWADPGDPGIDDGLRELRVLGEESVAGMDRVRTRDLGGGDQARDLEIRFARRRRPDADVVVREANVERLAIGVRVHGHRLNIELATGANDPKRDLAAIGDQDFLEHQMVYPAWRREWPAVLSAIAFALKVVPARVAGSLDTLRAQSKLARVGSVE